MKESNDWIDAKSQDVELMHYLACMKQCHKRSYMSPRTQMAAVPPGDA